MMFASFEGRKILVNVPFSKHICFELSGDISFSLPGPLWRAFELKIDLPTAKISRMQLR